MKFFLILLVLAFTTTAYAACDEQQMKATAEYAVILKQAQETLQEQLATLRAQYMQLLSEKKALEPKPKPESKEVPTP